MLGTLAPPRARAGRVLDARRLALVLGGARCVWRDVAALETLIGGPWPGLVIAVNDVGCVWPRRLDGWATVHPENLLTPLGWRDPTKARHGWLGLRLSKGHPAPRRLFSPQKDDRYRWIVDGEDRLTRLSQWASGSSGLFAVRAAYNLGAWRVVLAGTPMDRRPHFEESVKHHPDRSWTSADTHLKHWKEPAILPRLKERTRSLSGRTRDLLGPVTLEWLLS